MFNTEIVAIDITTKREDLITSIDDYIDNIDGNSKGTLSYRLEDTKLRSGKKVLKITLQNNIAGAFSIIAYTYSDNGNAMLKFESMNIRPSTHLLNGFYGTEYNDMSLVGDSSDDPSIVFMYILETLAVTTNGTLAYIDSGGSQMIISNGISLNPNIAMIDDNGDIYYAKHYTDNFVKVSITDDINVNIMDWINMHDDIKSQIHGKQANEAMDIIGMYLLDAKMKDNITQEEFYDIFRQAGNIGFTNQQLIMFYKILT